MSWRTTRVVLAVRKVARTLGVNRWLARRLQPTGYETTYDSMLMARIRPGDCVWDIGANVGYYTRRFADCVGTEGIVYAFEPSPQNFARLLASSGDLAMVRTMPMGLGRRDEALTLHQGVEELGATSRVAEDGHEGIAIIVRSGKSLVEQGDARPPNVIKIDVEGYELEAIDGLGPLLDAPDCRAVGIEVHFGILDERGLRHGAASIERALKRARFAVEWADVSHILATRNAG